MALHLYHVRRTDLTSVRYDAFTDFVVSASSEEEARLLHPREGAFWSRDHGMWIPGREQDTLGFSHINAEWPRPSRVEAICVGTTELAPGRVICASFRHG